MNGVEELFAFLRVSVLETGSLWVIGLSAAIGFAGIYFGLAISSWHLSRRVFPRLGWGRIVNPGPLFPGQVAFEIRYSLLSIAIFGLYGAFTAYALRQGWVAASFDVPSAGRFLWDLLLITLWNEVHFYFIHRALHWRPLYVRVHAVHHKSKVATPFSTYSFHWVESASLGSVMILAMLLHEYNISVLVLFPLVSLLINTSGHFNYSLIPDKAYEHPASGTKRHAAHHHYFDGNYGFLLPYMDSLFSSSLKRQIKSDEGGPRSMERTGEVARAQLGLKE